MAVAFPIPLAQFSDRLVIDQLTLFCPQLTAESRTGGGQIIRAAMGEPLWQGEIRLKPLRPDCGRSVQAVLDLLGRPGASFLFSPKGYAGPAATAILSAVAANNRDVTLSGLPAGTRIPADAFLSFTYGSSPTRYAFHQVAFAATANGAGQVTVEVSPIVRPGWTAGLTVQLGRPVLQAMRRGRDPGALVYYRQARASYRTGGAFEFIQKLV